MTHAEESAQVQFDVDIDQLTIQIQNRIRMFDRNAYWHQRVGEGVATWTAFLSALGTVSIALAAREGFWAKDIFNTIALLVSATTTGLLAWSGYFSHRQSHILYSDGRTRLWSIMRELEHIKKMKPDDETPSPDPASPVDPNPRGPSPRQLALRSVYLRFQALVEELHCDWKKQQIEGAQGAGGK